MQLNSLGRSATTRVALCVLLLAGTLGGATAARAEDDASESRDPRVRIGFEIAPVPLDLTGKNRALVGLGSYLVNAVASCNDCHTQSAISEYSPGGNPFFGQPKIVNTTAYLSGGRDFGALAANTPHIVSRNLTPDKSGRPEGGRSFDQFLHIMETGEDLDHVHPPCSATITTNCFPATLPFDGNFLQIMPWPKFQSMTVHDLRAIYEYLSAIPCIEGPPAPSILHNDCT
jgi:hypothetical protein